MRWGWRKYCSLHWFFPRSPRSASSQDLDHHGGSDDPGGSVVFQGEEFFIAGHQKLGLAGFNQCEQEAVLGVRSDGTGGQVSAKKREVAKASGEQFGQAGAKSRPEERPPGNVAEFRNECVTGDEREPLALPSVEKLGWRAQGREKGGDQDVGVEDEAQFRTVRRARGSVLRGRLRWPRQSSSEARREKRRRRIRGPRGRSDERCARGRLPR